MPKPRGGQRQQYNSGGGGSSGSRFQALNDYQNGGNWVFLLLFSCIAKYF